MFFHTRHGFSSRRFAGRDEKGTPVIPFWIFDWGFWISQSPVQNRQSKIGRVWGCPRNCESNDGCVPETVRHSPIELCQMRSARLIAGGRGTVERVRLPVGRGLFAGVHGFDEPGDLPVCVPQSRSRRLLFSPRASGIRGLWRAWLPRLPVSGGVFPLYGRSTPSVHEVARPWYRSGAGLEPPPKPRQR